MPEAAIECRELAKSFGKESAALQGVSNSIQFMVTGAVLLAAVVIDSLSRRSQKASGRA